MSILRQRSLFGRAAMAAALAAVTSASSAALMSGAFNTNHHHDGVTGANPISPFFTQAVNSAGTPTYNFAAANGLAGSVVSNTASSTTVSGTISVVGNATLAGGFTDGNGIPAGVTLSFPLSFTISSANGQNLITATGNTGNGLAIADSSAQTHGVLNIGETLNISAAIIGPATWSGAPTEPGYVLTGISAGGSKFVGFRSNNFTEASSGATLTAGGNSAGFGTSTGSLFSNLVIDNLGAPANVTGGLGLDVPTTLSTEATAASQWNLKGFALRHTYEYDLSVVPEPMSAGLLVVAAVALALRSRR